MGDTIKARKGIKASIDPLLLGEFGFTTDEERLYIGGNNGNIPLPNAADLSDLTNGSSVITATRDITLTGTQKITTPFKFKSIDIQCVSNQFAHVHGVGYCDYLLNQHSIFDNNGAISGSFSQNPNKAITVKFPSGGVLYGTITKIETDGITITWSNNGALTETGNTVFLLIKGVI